MSRRGHNESCLADYLDGTLEQLQPGSMDPDTMMGDKHRGESKAHLKEAQLKRLDEHPDQDQSHKMLLALMVEGDSRLARERPRQHSALATFIFTNPRGYQEMLNLEHQASRGAPLAGEVAAACRGGFDRTLDYLDEMDARLSVKPVPLATLKEHRKSPERSERARSVFERKRKQLGDDARAIRETAEETGYSASQVRRISEDLRREVG